MHRACLRGLHVADRHRYYQMMKNTPKAGAPVAVLREYLSYDPETGIFRWTRRPSFRVQVGDVAGSPTNNGYISLSLQNYKMLAHRAAWAITHGVWPSFEIDHINRDRCDNRIANLRQVSRSQNARNGKLRKNNAIGVSGVRKKYRRFIAQVCVNGRPHVVGRFNTAEEAHACYQAATAKLLAEPMPQKGCLPAVPRKVYRRPRRPSISLFEKIFEYRDGVLFWRGKSKIAGSRLPSGHIVVCLRGFRTPAHHVVWAMHNRCWPPKNKVLDHINCVPDDNRIENLRIATRAQNVYNKRSPKPNPTGFRGVIYEPERSRPYAAKARHGGKLVRIGGFMTAAEAKVAYDEFVRRVRGSFARTED